MHSRKIQLVGNRSYSVSLPKKWVESNKLKEQDVVNIVVTKDDNLLVSPNFVRSKDSREVKIIISDVDYIKELVYLCYIKNMGRVKLVADNISYADRRMIRKIIFHLEGYEILNENKKEIELSLVSIPMDKNVGKIVKRMLYLLEDSIEALIDGDFDLIEQNEHELDKFYHLSKKLLIQMMQNFELRIENEIVGFEDLFFLLSIVKKIENLGDLIYELKINKAKKDDLKSLKKYIDFLIDVFIYGRDTKDFYDYLNKREDKYELKTFSYLSKAHYLCQDILDNKIAINLNKTFFGENKDNFNYSRQE